VQLEVAHRQQRRELEEAFAIRAGELERQQAALRSQVRNPPIARKI